MRKLQTRDATIEMQHWQNYKRQTEAVGTSPEKGTSLQGSIF